jgi:hypothetical protein
MINETKLYVYWLKAMPFNPSLSANAVYRLLTEKLWSAT